MGGQVALPAVEQRCFNPSAASFEPERGMSERGGSARGCFKHMQLLSPYGDALKKQAVNSISAEKAIDERERV